jgi:RimJ/RimL family protein N-acetyltransferase
MSVLLEPWTDHDLDLLRRINTPEMTAHLGGPETEQQVIDRHARYVSLGSMFSIVVLPERQKAGAIGYWEREWNDQTVYETGWHVLPEFQGRGVATAAARAIIARAAAEQRHRYLHAYPSVDNPASNAICRKAGFTFLSERDFEYPPGHPLRCNDWRVDLSGRQE